MIALETQPIIHFMAELTPNQNPIKRKRVRNYTNPKHKTSTTCENHGRKLIPQGIHNAIWNKYTVTITIGNKSYSILSDERGPLNTKAILTVVGNTLTVKVQDQG